MGIKISTGPKTVLREIAVNEPIDGAGYKKHKVLASFEVVGKAEATELIKEGDVQLLNRVLVGWGDPKRDNRGGFEDDNGNPIPFSAEKRDEVLDTPWIAASMARGYMECAYGSKLGN